MLVLSYWDPTPGIVHCMKNKCRRVRDRTKGRQQSYFKGVFAEAQDEPDDTDAESEQSRDRLLKAITESKDS